MYSTLDGAGKNNLQNEISQQMKKITCAQATDSGICTATSNCQWVSCSNSGTGCYSAQAQKSSICH